jgi:serine/threonine-protein phosphatase 2A regulatory subunit B''
VATAQTSKPKSSPPTRSVHSRVNEGGEKVDHAYLVSHASNRAADIPRFYFPSGRPPADSQVQRELSVLDEVFKKSGGQMNQDNFTNFMKEHLEIPNTLSRILFTRLASANTALMTREAFLGFYTAHLKNSNKTTRFFNIVRGPSNNASFLERADWMPYVDDVLASHPGLEFLKATPQFQERYRETVAFRFYYTVNRSGDGRMTLKELQRYGKGLMDAFAFIDAEEDINRELKFFSYEHFYVLYCKFWELDADHDQLIDRHDLLNFANHSLTVRCVDRLFAEAPRKLSSGVEGKMCYEDFVWFLLSEEDKTTETANEYWFRVLDLDGDGIVTIYDAEYFYQEQIERMESIGMEIVPFEDVLCQMIDMIKPNEYWKISMRDIRKCKLIANFFNVLFNLNKFVAFEQRDPFALHPDPEDLEQSHWERYARAEYDRLALEEMEEEGYEEDENGEMFNGGHGYSSESPF